MVIYDRRNKCINQYLIFLRTELNFGNFNEEVQPKDPKSEEEKALPKKWDAYEVR